ncbi:DNA invertase Pin-like site-specific DNA recombinase [Variovorax paradoxus]|uniref:DNA invertase Pin-like site-specific DNA recombinase n=1 Tax=Variovorax paradoxus TaxID=34073 RepID=A0AAW8EN03_VARPD|nr:recombinase family protein [Variovorax paradoxus]MDP9974551.1 DNA invertase Pin-like site-specific DNA recombinase [Variovorax paradoxus]
MPTAYSYIRFSSEKQQLGDSLRRQVEHAEKYAQRAGFTLDHSSYRDLGISAFKGRNASEGKLGTFLRAVEQGLIASDSTLLIEDFDRLSRDEIDNALSLFLRIIQSGITLVTLKDEQVYTRERIRRDQASLIVSIMYLGRAHDESKMKSRRVSQAWDAKRQSGKPMTAVGPAWLKLAEDRSQWLVLEEKARVVRTIFKLALAGNGAPTIAKILNTEDTPTMKSAPHWTFGNVAAILKNSAVIGMFTPKKAVANPIPDYYPKIISETDFALTQQAMAKRRWLGGRGSETVANLFAGLSYCHVCDGKMRIVGQQGKHVYLKCQTAYAGMGCDEGRFPYRAAEKAILQHMARHLASRLAFDSTESEDPALVLRQKRDELNRRQRNLIASLEEVGSPALRQRINELQLQIDDIERKLSAALPARARAVANEETAVLLKTLEWSAGDEFSLELRKRLQLEVRRMLEAVYFWCDVENSRPTVALKYLSDLGGRSYFLDVTPFMEKIGGARPSRTKLASST